MRKYIFSPILIIAIIIMLLIIIARKNSTKTWEYVMNKQIEMYPELQPQDIYKIIYQGIMGPNHLAKTKEAMTNYLTMEYNKISADAEVPLVEQIAPDDKYIRINLKRFKADNRNLDILGDILYQSCVKTETIELEKTLSIFNSLIEKGKINYSAEKWTEYYKQVKNNEYPIPHHSDTYLKKYDPSYRVVSLEIWEASNQ